MTTAQAKAELKPLGIELTKIGPVFRVGPRFGGEAQANINRSWSFKLRSLVTGEESQSGQAFVEYALLLAVISLGIVASANILVSAVQTASQNIAARLVTASQSTSTQQ
jgi:Flp pilus assembly pilin Flp